MISLKKITYNCRKATFLIEKKNNGRISVKEELELKYHLAGCSVCRIFQQQSRLIDQMFKAHLFNDVIQIKLDNNFKRILAKRIVDEMEVNNNP